MLSGLGEPPVRFLCCWLPSCHLLMFFSLLFDIIPHPSVDYRRGFYTPFYILSPAHCRVIRDTSVCSTIPFLPQALRSWVGIFYLQAFFTLRSFPTFLAQAAFIKASLGASSYSFKFAGLHTDPQNTDLAHLLVWFTVTRNVSYILSLYLCMSILQKFYLWWKLR